MVYDEELEKEMKWWICGNEMEMEEYMDSEMEMET
jgi:hypothetical protein